MVANPSIVEFCSLAFLNVVIQWRILQFQGRLTIFITGIEYNPFLFLMKQKMPLYSTCLYC